MGGHAESPRPHLGKGWLDDRVQWTDSIDEALEHDADVFVELIGGLDPAEHWIRRALERGISVVTANKQVIAHAGPALMETAASSRCQLRFEASVAGGVPVIRAIESGLAGDRLTQVAGILNGTCNYILTRMERDGVAFAEALKEAQALGFAEADPSQDIDGRDARAWCSRMGRHASPARARPPCLALQYRANPSCGRRRPVDSPDPWCSR